MRGTWEEFKSNFDVGKSGRCREGTDGSLRSFDRELKARSRQFSDATSIVTMGGGTLSSLSLSIFLFLSFSFPFCSFSLSLSLWILRTLSLARTRVSLRHTEPPPPPHPPPPTSVFFRARPSACLSPPPPRRRSRAPKRPPAIFPCLLRPVR